VQNSLRRRHGRGPGGRGPGGRGRRVVGRVWPLEALVNVQPSCRNVVGGVFWVQGRHFRFVRV
jgi:hypothetical protein